MKLLLLTIATLVSANAALVTRTTFNAATNALAAEIATKQDTIWNNTGGVIAPASGQDTNVLRFTSGLADNATNVAMVVQTAEPWSFGSGASLLKLRNHTNDSVVAAAHGGFALGPNTQSEDFNGALSQRYSVLSTHVTTLGDSTQNNLGIETVNDATYSQYAWFDVNTDLSNDTNTTSRVRIVAESNEGSGTWEIKSAFGASTTGSSLTYEEGGGIKIRLSNNGTITAAQGSEPSAPAAGYYTLFAIDNGGGKMVLKVRFPTGASQTIATEP